MTWEAEIRPVTKDQIAGLGSFDAEKRELERRVFGDRVRPEILLLERCRRAWPRIAGALAENSRPESVQGSTLVVLTNSPSQAQMLLLCSMELLGRIREELLWDVSGIRTRVGRISKKNELGEKKERGSLGKEQDNERDARRALLEGLRKLDSC